MILNYRLELWSLMVSEQVGSRSKTPRVRKWKLPLYALTCGALLGMPVRAHAKIIVHELAAPFTVTSIGVNFDNFYKLDFDGNGAYDGLLAAFVDASNSPVLIQGVAFAGSPSAAGGVDDAADLPGGLVESVLLGGGAYATDYKAPATPASAWLDPPAWRDVALLGIAYFVPDNQNSFDGAWGNGNRYWSAVKFEIDGGRATTGWVDVQTRFSRSVGAQFTVYSLAYDDLTTVPEPSSLWMAAAACAAGILTLRRPHSRVK